MLSAVVKLLRLASILICLIVAAAFLVFAVNQTKTASGHQQEELSGTAQTPSTTSKSQENWIHRDLDEASESLTSPFSGIVSGVSSEWANQGIRLLLTLVVYGFGLGYIARVLRVRV